MSDETRVAKARKPASARTDRKSPAALARRISRGRLIRLVAVGGLAGLTGWAAAAFGPLALAVAAAAFLAAAAIVAWNVLPIAFTPNPAYKPAPAEKLRWPEAAPIEPSGRHDRAIMCVHGFPSTPADYRRFVDASAARGWDLAAPLLPGCGTAPEDLLSTEWSQYLAMVRDTWAGLRKRYETACVVGISMGGALSLALAEEACPDPALAPAAIATVGAPAVLNAWYKHGIIANPLLYLARTIAPLVPSIGAAYPDPDRRAEDGSGDWKGYEGLYPRQAYTLQVGLRAMERRLGRITCPALVCHGRGDKIVDFRNSGVIMAGLGSSRIEAYIANMDAFGHNRHNLLIFESQRDLVWARILDFFEARLAERDKR